MTIMLEAVKRQLKSTYDHAILSYVMSILGFLAAMVMWLVLRGVLRKEAQYVPLGTIMGIGTMRTLYSVFADFSDETVICSGNLNGKYQKNLLLILSAGAGIVQCRKLYSSGSPDPAGKENQTISGSA